MESLGLLIIFILCPIVGVYFSIFGFFDYRKKRSRKKILIGLTLISMPFFVHFGNIAWQKYYERILLGKYVIDGSEEIALKLNSDKTFVLYKCDSIYYSNNYGKSLQSEKGSWIIQQADVLLLELQSSNQSIIYYEVNTSGTLN